MAAGQIKFAFDSVTLTKIWKGLLYAAILPCVIAILQYIGTLDFGNAAVTMIVSYLVPVIINIIREWIKGAEPQ
jgi:drug/metabolite transporter (DMT)-like permease